MSTLDRLTSSLAALRDHGSLPISDAQREQLGAEWLAHRSVIRSVAARYFRSRVDGGMLLDAVGWLAAETYAYAMEITARDREVPIGLRRWLQLSRIVRRRYWSQQLVADGVPVGLLGESGTDLATRVHADRLRLDDLAFGDVLRDYAAAGHGGRLAHGDRETIAAWIALPHATASERAEWCGLASAESWRTRERRCRERIRAGAVGALAGELAD